MYFTVKCFKITDSGAFFSYVLSAFIIFLWPENVTFFSFWPHCRDYVFVVVICCCHSSCCCCFLILLKWDLRSCAWGQLHWAFQIQVEINNESNIFMFFLWVNWAFTLLVLKMKKNVLFGMIDLCWRFLITWLSGFLLLFFFFLLRKTSGEYITANRTRNQCEFLL